jgi:threonine dehydrogenase-like Zn-dependent dehydrogenase
MVGFPGLDFTRKEMTIVGSRASVDCFPESLDLIARGAIRYPDIASSFTLAEAPGVFARLAENTSALHKAGVRDVARRSDRPPIRSPFLSPRRKPRPGLG